MLEISKPVIVEGRYDRERVLSVAKANVITTEGFGIFKKAEKAALIKRLAKKSGVIVLTDSDGAGLVIRNYIRSILLPSEIYDVYIPQISGKEKRKPCPSKEGYLGVEGMDLSLLEKALMPFSDGMYMKNAYVTKKDFYFLGLSGGEKSAEKRVALSVMLALPDNLSCSSLISAVNLLISETEFTAAVKKIQTGEF